MRDNGGAIVYSEGRTRKMPTAGQIPAAWLDDARTNETEGSRVEDWIAAQGNWSSVQIDAEGAVWVEGAGGGRWLSQAHIDDVIARIDGQGAAPARQRLLALLERDPELSLVALAEALSVSRARVQQLLREEGYAYQPYRAMGRWTKS